MTPNRKETTLRGAFHVAPCRLDQGCEEVLAQLEQRFIHDSVVDVDIVIIGTSSCCFFWMLLKVLKIHDYIILYRVSHGIPRGLIQTLMGTTLDDKPTIHQPHNEPPEIFDRPSRRVATTPRSSEGCRTSRSRWPQDQKPSKTGSSAGWGT